MLILQWKVVKYNSIKKSFEKSLTLVQKNIYCPGFEKNTGQINGCVAQLVRALPCHGRGHEFESRRVRHYINRWKH